MGGGGGWRSRVGRWACCRRSGGATTICCCCSKMAEALPLSAEIVFWNVVGSSTFRFKDKSRLMSVCKFGLLDSPPPTHLATYFNGFFFFRLLDFIVVVVVLLGEFRLPIGGRIMCKNSVGTESINYRIVKKSLGGPTNKNITLYNHWPKNCFTNTIYFWSQSTCLWLDPLSHRTGWLHLNFKILSPFSLFPNGFLRGWSILSR